MSLIILSFDAVCDDDIDFLLQQPHFKALTQNGTLVRETESTFITNTYPVHTSVITGCRPNRHGVVENVFTQPEKKKPDWRWYRDAIKTTTLYDEAAKKGLKTCAVFWPVTAGSKTKIKYNMPEIFSPDGSKNQLLLSLSAGSKLFQLQCFLRYSSGLRGIEQPYLDDFALSSALFAMKRYPVDLLLLHQTDVDTHKHHCGVGCEETIAALKRLDTRLGQLTAANPAADILIFGDHGSLPVHTGIDLNKHWNLPGTYWHGAGGCAFLKVWDANTTPSSAINTAIEAMLKNPAIPIHRRLRDDEMAQGGLDREFTIGVEAQAGYHFSEEDIKAQHGYSLEQPHYKTFYAVKGGGIAKGRTLRGGSLLDIAPLAARLLHVPLWYMDGKLETGVLG